MPTTPPDRQDFIERTAGRAIVLDPDRRTLLVHGQDPEDLERGGFWWTPGGGLDEGETLGDGTRRELWEELGLRVEDLGPIVMERVGEFPLDGNWYRQYESFFIVDLDHSFEPDPQYWEEIEQRAITELRWLSLGDLEALDEPFYPKKLAKLIEYYLDSGRPAEPWTESQLV